jgi:hypothetical protein
MTTTINASTSSGLVMTPDNSGNVMLQYNGVSTPAFSAYQSSQQTITQSSPSIVQFQTEEWDTAGYFNNTGSGNAYAFQPLVAGYYQINAQVSYSSITATEVQPAIIYKNGSQLRRGNRFNLSSTNAYGMVSSLVYLNGSTDYIQIYTFHTASGSVALEQLDVRGNYFNGYLVRGA